MHGKRKRSWPQWIIVALILLPTVYVASFGPMSWIFANAQRMPPRPGAKTVDDALQTMPWAKHIYVPLFRYTPWSVTDCIWSYAKWFDPNCVFWHEVMTYTVHTSPGWIASQEQLRFNGAADLIRMEYK